jgi:hypothetical protein
MQAMFQRSIHRRLVALVAAYALALQGLLLTVVSSVSPALAPSAAICSSATPSHGEPGRKGPVHRSDCPGCALACGGAAMLPSRAASLILAFGPSEAMRALPASAPVARAQLHAGLARAPPV